MTRDERAALDADYARHLSQCSWCREARARLAEGAVIGEGRTPNVVDATLAERGGK